MTATEIGAVITGLTVPLGIAWAFTVKIRKDNNSLKKENLEIKALEREEEDKPSDAVKELTELGEQFKKAIEDYQFLLNLADQNNELLKEEITELQHTITTLKKRIEEITGKK